MEEVVDMLPFIGLDIEGTDDTYIRLEYSPNRPDFSTYFGIVRSLRGMLDYQTGLPIVTVLKINDHKIDVEELTQTVRPYIQGLVAKGKNLDRERIKQLVAMQEDLHNGIGRRRLKASIGFHDFDKTKFPLRYSAIKSDAISFLPLGSEANLSLKEILEDTETGKKYRHLLKGESYFPIVKDMNDDIISFPPIINSEVTKIDINTQNLFVEVTGIYQHSVEDMIANITYTLYDMGFKVETVLISKLGEENYFPCILDNKFENISIEYINSVLGLNLKPSDIVDCLRRCRLDGSYDNNKLDCIVPRFRSDILNPIDLVEEVAIGYGIFNLKPQMPQHENSGSKSETTKIFDKLRQLLIGMGLIENLNFTLSNNIVQKEYVNRIYKTNEITVNNSKSREYEILRESLLPSLLRCLSRNVHEPYPQRLFEIGKVFSNDHIPERWHLCCVCAHSNSDYTEIKSILQTTINMGFKLEIDTSPILDETFIQGRAAMVKTLDKFFGIIGEISPLVIEKNKIRVPISAFEIDLTTLLSV
jgi:phenylalanyl-tRNA synthetase beta chain